MTKGFRLDVETGTPVFQTRPKGNQHERIQHTRMGRARARRVQPRPRLLEPNPGRRLRDRRRRVRTGCGAQAVTRRYLSMTDVAERLGITKGALARYKLPKPDVLVGRARGWSEKTIDAWNAARPGRGVGGGRPRKK